ncbi:hypothetical protein EV368DRAFT_70494 [Lentinula lateritia]|nr:hypothetical protein EV368DRAFT_70494 [Lentinula lateritia]
MCSPNWGEILDGWNSRGPYVHGLHRCIRRGIWTRLLEQYQSTCLWSPAKTRGLHYYGARSSTHGLHFGAFDLSWLPLLLLVQSFIAATSLTNTTQFNTIQGLQQMMAYLHGITQPGNDRMYLMELKKAKKTQEPDGSHVIPHKFTFHILEDVIGFCNLFNILMLGSIIEERRYREQVEADLWDDDHHIPEDELHFYANAGERAIQCRALVLHKFITQSQGIQAEDRCITPERIRRAIATDFPEAMESDYLWPKNLSLATLKDWP